MSRRRIKIGWDGRSEEIDVNVPDSEPVPWDAASQLAVVGQPTPRLDAVAKVTGRAKYTQDLELPGTLVGRILRSPVPSARLASIDVEAARTLEGVRAVWVEKEGKRVFYAGQEVAAVAATTAAIAEAALALIQVRYDELPFVVDATAAREPGAPPVFVRAERPTARPPSPTQIGLAAGSPASTTSSSSDGGGAASASPEAEGEPAGARVKTDGNVRTTTVSQPPGVDIDRAFAEADVVVENTFRTQVQTHAALETHGALAAWSDDQVTIWTSTQAAYAVREQVAQALKIGKDRVRVLCEHMGGGFGAKFDAGPHTVLAARLAREAKAPVKIMLSRHEEHLCTGNRPDSVQWLKLGARRDGTLVALHLRSYGTPGIGTGAGVGGPARALYQIKSWRTEEADVFTNAGPAQPFRAPGHPQGTFALEQSIDELAALLGMDPVALRKRNLANPVQLAELDRITSGPLSIVTQAGPGQATTMRRAAVWPGRGRPGAGAGVIKRGVGLACGVWYRNVTRNTTVQLELRPDCTVEVRCGVQDIGTGTRTLMAMVAAEELQLPLSAISVRLGDTGLPHGPGSGGSTTATSVAPTVRAAAAMARRRVMEIAARLLVADPGELTLQDGLIVVKRDLGGGIRFAAACAKMSGDKISVTASRAADFEGRWERTGGVQVAEVDVDTRTGQVRVARITAIHDCGRVLNPLTAVSQIHGGIVQGLSYALFEARVMDERAGRMVNTDLESYRIAGPADCPEIEVALFPTSPGWNSTGALGLGEAPTIPTAAAIANAIHNAIGVRVRELPITPDKVLAALAGAAATAPLDDPKGMLE